MAQQQKKKIKQDQQQPATGAAKCCGEILNEPSSPVCYANSPELRDDFLDVKPAVHPKADKKE